MPHLHSESLREWATGGTELGRSNCSQSVDELLIPIVVGVAGHRDLRPEHLAPLEQKAREIFQAFREKYPDSPITLLSALAEGADRLVAKVALEFGAELIVPFPMPASEYKKDFTNPPSEREFDELLTKSRHSFELPLVQGNTAENIATAGEHRDKQYALLATFIARHSQILIALWDGVDSKLLGGTSNKIRYKLEGTRQPYAKYISSLSQVETGPVYHIVTPRISNPKPVGRPFELIPLYPTYWGARKRAENAYAGMLKRADKYNSDARKHRPKLAAKALNSRSSVIPIDRQRNLDADCRTMLNRYALADVLAQEFKRLRLGVLKSLFFLVIIGFFFFQMHIDFWKSPYALLVYPVLVGIGVTIYLWAKRNECEYKHEDYRALADAMRVQFVWALVGIDEKAADHYFYKHKGELEWIRYAVRAWSIPSCVKAAVDTDNYRIALDNWVGKQKLYFMDRSSDNKVIGERLHRVSKLLFVLGVSAAVLLFVLELVSGGFNVSQNRAEWIKGSIAVVISMSLAIAAALQGYLEKAALSEQSKQYAKMASLYGLAWERLSQDLMHNRLDGAKELFLDLGREALIENGDWLLLHRQRPLEVPNV
jgi:hypothetical protein